MNAVVTNESNTPALVATGLRKVFAARNHIPQCLGMLKRALDPLRINLIIFKQQETQRSFFFFLYIFSTHLADILSGSA